MKTKTALQHSETCRLSKLAPGRKMHWQQERWGIFAFYIDEAKNNCKLWMLHAHPQFTIIFFASLQQHHPHWSIVCRHVYNLMFHQNHPCDVHLNQTYRKKINHGRLKLTCKTNFDVYCCYCNCYLCLIMYLLKRCTNKIYYYYFIKVTWCGTWYPPLHQKNTSKREKANIISDGCYLYWHGPTK